MVVESVYLRGYFLLHTWLDMHGDDGLSFPHGPCIMCLSTRANPTGSSVLFGSSAEMIALMSEVDGILGAFSNHKSMCACGNPRF